MNDGKSNPVWSPPSITGDELYGEKHVRFAYIDEAGISNKRHEPYLVMAGVIVHPDRQYREIRRAIRALADECFPDINYMFGKEFNFHAKDIWHGSGKFPRKDWPRSKRIELIARLIDIITQNDLPVVYGIVNRLEHERKLKNRPGRTMSERSMVKDAACVAYFRCIRRIEEWMRRKADDEVISLIVENNNETKRVIADFHSLITNKVDRGGHMDDHMDGYMDGYPEFFVSNHIVEAINFVEKDRSPIIQLADICAFVAKRKLQNCPDIGLLFNKLEKRLHHKSSSGSGLAAYRGTDVMVLADWLAVD